MKITSINPVASSSVTRPMTRLSLVLARLAAVTKPATVIHRSSNSFGRFVGT